MRETPWVGSLRTGQRKAKGPFVDQNVAPNAVVPCEVLGPRFDAVLASRLAHVSQAGLDGPPHGIGVEIEEVFRGLSANFWKAGERREKNWPAEIHGFDRG